MTYTQTLIVGLWNGNRTAWVVPIVPWVGALKIQDWKMQDWKITDLNLPNLKYDGLAMRRQYEQQ